MPAGRPGRHSPAYIPDPGRQAHHLEHLPPAGPAPRFLQLQAGGAGCPGRGRVIRISGRDLVEQFGLSLIEGKPFGERSTAADQLVAVAAEFGSGRQRALWPLLAGHRVLAGVQVVKFPVPDHPPVQHPSPPLGIISASRQQPRRPAARTGLGVATMQRILPLPLDLGEPFVRGLPADAQGRADGLPRRAPLTLVDHSALQHPASVIDELHSPFDDLARTASPVVSGDQAPGVVAELLRSRRQRESRPGLMAVPIIHPVRLDLTCPPVQVSAITGRPDSERPSARIVDLAARDLGGAVVQRHRG